MKINQKINKRVKESMEECRKQIVSATIELLKAIGAEPNKPVALYQTLILYQQVGKNTQTVLANQIVYDEKNEPFFIVSMGDDYFFSSPFISLSNLYVIYKEVRGLVSAE